MVLRLSSIAEMRASGVAEVARRVIALCALLLLLGLLATTYVGSSSSPYGTCYAASGRAVPCNALHH